MIYVGLTAWEFASTDNCGPTGCNGGGNALFAQGFDKNFMTMNSSGSEAQQCSNENRPPTDAPVHRKTKSKFKLNKTLRDARDWSRRVQLSGLPGPIQSSLLLHRALTTSKVGGPYDFSHADNTVFEGTQSYGNFFFAAHLRAMDVSPSIILRASSAYQHITDIGGFSEMIIPHDIKWAGICYVSQSCDDEVDAKWLLNGIKYVDEVFSQSGNDIDTDDSSCTDWEEANNDTASNTGPFGNTNGGGGSGGGSSTGGSSTGRIISVPSNTSSGEGWCFVQPPYAPYCWDA